MNNSGKPSIRLEDVTVELGGKTILDKENLELEGTGLVVVIGPNGGGKTTLFRTVAGLVKPVEGRILVLGVDVTGDPATAGKYIAFMPQLSQVNRGFPVTGFELVASALTFESGPPRLFLPREKRRIVLEVLERVGAVEFADKPLSSLSGGQIQRVLLARALIRDTPIMLLDEPLSAIDPRGKGEIIREILRETGERLVLLSTHDPSIFKDYARKFVVVSNGIRALGSPEEVMSPEILKEVYGDMVFIVEKCVHLVDTHGA